MPVLRCRSIDIQAPAMAVCPVATGNGTPSTSVRRTERKLALLSGGEPWIGEWSRTIGRSQSIGYRARRCVRSINRPRENTRALVESGKARCFLLAQARLCAGPGQDGARATQTRCRGKHCSLASRLGAALLRRRPKGLLPAARQELLDPSKVWWGGRRGRLADRPRYSISVSLGVVPRWYSRVVEVPLRIEVAAGFVAPGASEPPRLQPSSPPGGSGPAHG